MKIKDHLDKGTKRALNDIGKRNKEKLSTKELEELMGVNRDRYERRGGAVRRK
ncbi:hypothetical protein AWH56_010640 [Anaerobacillus isosaccharinicus]|uniref:Uncharacterized protein n=1 Tax=Anaerobacillus isosaccharinicus TaxID=1532552 RepID=A0A7S7LBQ0_9BACI|nr:hypothetical protein [Anaerobacillus isosaccharinicus]MBA5588612.1 hypothetical protein [Anaerobacillus isosaccharinicus]QOY37977.1 hypothetical protein AWH56_010640 [Anaerobacillus isosaccharinicus]